MSYGKISWGSIDSAGGESQPQILNVSPAESVELASVTPITFNVAVNNGTPTTIITCGDEVVYNGKNFTSSYKTSDTSMTLAANGYTASFSFRRSPSWIGSLVSVSIRVYDDAGNYVVRSYGWGVQ